MTKVYRGADYNALLWAFGRLFERVRAHKPAASRTQSAEIFVVCEKYLAPPHVDPKLLDPRFVFADIDGPGGGTENLSVLHPQWGKKRRNREGYADDAGVLRGSPAPDATVFSRAPLSRRFTPFSLSLVCEKKRQAHRVVSICALLE